MFRALVPRRSRLAAILAIAVVGASAASAHAQTLTFNSLTDPGNAGIRYVPNCYTESGFVVTVVGVACGDPLALATAGPADPLLYTGSPALFLNDPTASLIDFTMFGGGIFSFQSISFAPFFGANTAVGLTGFRSDGSLVSANLNIPGSLVGLQTFSTTTFTDLKSLRVSALNQFGEPIVQFDNVAFTSLTAAPEPATLGLMMVGLIGVGAFVRRRRSRNDADDLVG